LLRTLRRYSGNVSQPSGTAFSFVDAAIITAARRYDARHIATFDREFAGLKGITVVR
jgi:predicted nucleic acid-binding protein